MSASSLFRASIADKNFTFRDLEIADPVPTGRQLLEAAGLRPAEEHILVQVLEDGGLEEVRLDETVDLREPGRERFVGFRSDRSFRFVLDERRFEWGDGAISEAVLKKLARVDLETHGVWFELTDEPDRLLDAGAEVSLGGTQVERFRTGLVYFVCIEGTLYPWTRDTIAMEEIAKLGGWDASQGVIEVDEHQNERQLAPGEVVKLKPGHVFGKRHRWKRGAR